MHTMLASCIPFNQGVITQAASLLRAGEVVAFPTETVYGLGARIFDNQAVKKIFDVKGRPQDNPIIAHIAQVEQVREIATAIPDNFYLLASKFFPGPLSLIVPKKKTVPDIVSAGLPMIAVRMPHHPVAQALITAVGEPLVAPSANLSGKPSPTTAQHVFDDLNGKIPFIIDGGPCTVGIESTVLDLTSETPTILRPGAISKEMIEEVLQQNITMHMSSEGPVRSPGMKYRHYAPEARIHLFTDSSALHHFLNEQKNTILLLSNNQIEQLHTVTQRSLSKQTLFAAFREADKNHIKDIAIFIDAKAENDKGLMNRILKASSQISS